jgi:phosphoglucosamine mutase
MPDNGIKFLARGGQKLDDALEDEIEAHLGQEWERPTGDAVGRVTPYGPTVEEYAAHLVGTLDDPSGKPLAGLRVVLDCAHGAASEVGPKALADAGASVIAIGVDPDGLNINEGCGSTHLDLLREAVLQHGADAGFAVDGDADRCLAVDHTGELVDGDQIMAVLALALQERGQLAGDTLVATVMSNLGMIRALETAGISVRQTAVGDRYVLEEMRNGGYTLGGEQSGHVVMRAHATTGDGLLTALQVLQRMATTGRSLRELASVMTRLPQVLVNVPDVDKARCASDEALGAAVAEAEASLAGLGRVLLRPSGTEPLVRVMVEAPTAQQAQDVADQLALVVRERLAL